MTAMTKEELNAMPVEFKLNGRDVVAYGHETIIQAAKRLFPGESLQRIAKAIADSELAHTGEICFAVDPSLHPRQVMSGVEAREQAAEVFARLRRGDTEANNAVLLYLLLAAPRIQ